MAGGNKMKKYKCIECGQEKDINECKPTNYHSADNPDPQLKGKVDYYIHNFICKDCLKHREENGRSK
jgi:hypothetical protein